MNLLASLGVSLILMSLILFIFTSTMILRIPYSDDSTLVQWKMNRQTSGPFYVYAYLENFHGNFRRFTESRPHYYYPQACGEYDSVDSAFYVRPKASLPELAGRGLKELLIPCGLTSITYFNDQISLLTAGECDLNKRDGCEESRELFIDTSDIAGVLKFSLFAEPWNENLCTANTSCPRPKSEMPWIDPLIETRFQSWTATAFTSDFRVLLGTLRDYTLKRGVYILNITENLWPSSHFRASKSIDIVTLGTLGASQEILAILALSFGVFLVLVALIFLLGINRNIVLQSDTRKFGWRSLTHPVEVVGSSADELKHQWIEHAKAWVNNRNAWTDGT